MHLYGHKQLVEHLIYPWYTSQILEQKLRIRQLQRKADKYRNIPSCNNAYKAARNIYVRLLQSVKRESINDLIKSFSGNARKIFNLVNNLTGTKQKTPYQLKTIYQTNLHHSFWKKITKSEMGLITFLHINHNHTPILSITLLILHHSQMKMSIA